MKTQAVIPAVAHAVLMVEPNTFGYDEDTARSNSFQTQSRDHPAAITAAAMREFMALRQLLSDHGVRVVSFSHELGQGGPNAVFPNNWLTTWPDGRVYIYPMAHESRRRERLGGVLTELQSHFQIARTIDLTDNEAKGRFLEGTGSMVFDHTNRIVYACRSNRCDEDLLRTHADELGYEAVVFSAHTPDGRPIYHTNVMLSVQEKTAVICPDVLGADQAESVAASLKGTGHDLVEIAYAQLEAYCANIIQLVGHYDEPLILMSKTAYAAFSRSQRDRLERSGRLIYSDVPTIEAAGGGSARCMVAEIFLPSA